VLLKKLGCKIESLSPESLCELEMLITNHKPSHSTNVSTVTHGGNNILYGPFVKLGHEQWNQLEKKCLHLQTQTVWTTKCFWKDKTSVPLIYPTYMVSKIVSGTHVHLQKAHSDFNPMVCKATVSKPLITFAPACPEGSMLLLWSNDWYTTKNQETYNKHYYFYIPFGSIVYFPGNTIHTGFFVSKENQEAITATKEFIFTFACNGSGSHPSNDVPISDVMIIKTLTM